MRVFRTYHEQAGSDNAGDHGERGPNGGRSLAVTDEDGFAGGEPVGKRQFLIDDVVAPQWHRQQNAQESGGGQPGE